LTISPAYVITFLLLGCITPVLEALQVPPTEPQPAPTRKTAEPKAVEPQTTCDGDTSAALTTRAWRALDDKKAVLALACASKTIATWTAAADAQQTSAAANGCPQPQPTEKERYFAANWALSDIGTSYYIRGRAFEQIGKAQDARTAYSELKAKYSCAHTWDPRGWFWKTADGADERLAIISSQGATPKRP
jgi:hypothetical protein